MKETIKVLESLNRDLTDKLEELHTPIFRTDLPDHEDEESYTEEDFARDEEQANYERDDKLGAI